LLLSSSTTQHLFLTIALAKSDITDNSHVS